MKKVLRRRCVGHETIFSKTNEVGQVASKSVEGAKIKELEGEKKLQGEYFDNMKAVAGEQPAERIYTDVDGVMINSILVVGDPTMEGNLGLVWLKRGLVRESK